jgi:hypothetical protein
MRYGVARRRTGVIGAAVLAAVVGCKDDEPTQPQTDSIQSFIVGVQTASGTVQASRKEGAPPAAGSGPAASVEGVSTFILGGPAIRTISAATAFNRIIVALEGVQGYYELTLPSSVTEQGISIILAQQLPRTSFTVRYATGAGGTIGTYDTEPAVVEQVGTGDVQVSVTWDTPTDVDLHVVDPSGEEIYYGNDVSASGGRLDLDSNRGCDLDNKNAENITWPSGQAPTGQYIVRVDYWSACDVTQTTTFTVTVRVSGRQAQVFTGTFVPADESNGGEGAGRLITQFTR